MKLMVSIIIFAGWFQIPSRPGCTVCCCPEQQVAIQATPQHTNTHTKQKQPNNVKCLTVNEINTDIKNAQQEACPSEESTKKKRSVLVGEPGKERDEFEGKTLKHEIFTIIGLDNFLMG